jgi:TPR repeat protein
VGKRVDWSAWPHCDLAAHIAAADQGDPAAARRVAELYEVIDDGISPNAKRWWYRAAQMGDLDARDYVAAIFPDD